MGDWQCALDPENVADQERTASRRLENRRVPGGSVSAPLQIALHAPSPERDCDRPSLSPNRAMPLATPLTTFGDLARDRLKIEVTCGNCGHRRIIDAASPRLRNRKIAGARFRCERCGSVGLPTIGKQRRWPGWLADHARKLR